MKIELKEQKSYIVKSNLMYNTVFKVNVLEVTETTYYLNLETGSNIRYLKSHFSDNFKVIEDLGEISSK
jgi:hypothetical protein